MKQNDKQIPVILIVDDVEGNARLLKRWLKNGISGADCNRRKRGGQSDAERTSAADLAGYYDAGYERLPVLRIIKRKSGYKDIPVIFVSAASELDDKMKGFQVGAVDFISKPFDYGEVAMRVNTHLKMYQMKQELEDSNRRLSIIVSEQAKKYDEEQKRLLKALAKITEGNNATGMTKHLENVAYNARLLAQALNFTEKYETRFLKLILKQWSLPVRYMISEN